MCEKKCPLSKTADGTCERRSTGLPNDQPVCFTDKEWYALISIPIKGLETCPFESHQKPVKSEWDLKVEKAFGLYYGDLYRDLVPTDKASHFKKSIREAGLK